MKNSIANIVLKAIALAMSVAAIVTGILGVVTPETGVMLLGIGLFTLVLTNF